MSFKSSLYILDNSSLSDIPLANIFSQSVARLFILLTLYFAEQKFLILRKSSVSILPFVDHSFGVVSSESLPSPRSSRFLFCYLLRIL